MNGHPRRLLDSRPRRWRAAFAVLCVLGAGLTQGCALSDAMHDASAGLRRGDMTTFSLMQRGSYWAAYGLTAWLWDVLFLPFSGAAVGFSGAQGDDAQTMLAEPGRIFADLFQFVALPVDFVFGMPGYLVETMYEGK